MKINTWWDGDPDERYWLEITDRPDVGTDLNCLQRNGSGKQYWLLVIGLRPDHRVEVKGTTTDARTVELTINEVENARNHANDLVVVHGITATARPDGGYDARDGTMRVWEKWVPANSALDATKFAYYVDSQQPDHEL
ncbi:hypothetical protein JOD54_004835 [Actinokineospora baliensis]|uniref:protein NO VEIN domain-containing protein n=1 Tax=Actinokineospora baliensis TaxID=547056 RepID=UPI00195E2F67|nr:DUF3883 domain-containing protein [Actinokineospora baliensis]MBM7774631.1 hypothetical protein [Actinokineospora baliensis]